MRVIEVFAENNTSADLVATFESDELYNKCLPLIEEFYLAQGYDRITERSEVVRREHSYITKAREYLIADSDEELLESINLIITHNDQSELIDSVVKCLVWDKVALEFTCEEFLEQIGYEDLFTNHLEELPQEVLEIINKYSSEDNTYEVCGNLLNELEPLGYSFEYGLDATPYNLKKI